MFVNFEYWNFFRFLWWDNGNVDSILIEYRMIVYLFGVILFLGCVNFILKRIVDDFEELFGSELVMFVKKDFYVDDGLKLVFLVIEVLVLIKSIKSLFVKGGFNFYKFILNSKEVIEVIFKE